MGAITHKRLVDSRHSTDDGHRSRQMEAEKYSSEDDQDLFNFNKKSKIRLSDLRNAVNRVSKFGEGTQEKSKVIKEF